ncbi:hypothetical protein ONZ45_g5365 [Pleurotus djamor]|nr:hypothetical protein ONZ45_g5365 [Pleurotus djamor]
MESFSYPHLSRVVYVALFTAVSNAAHLRQRIINAASLTGDEGERERDAVNFAFIDARLITSKLHLQTAIHQAMLADSQGSLRTKTVHSEVIWILNPTNNITEALRRYGVSETTTSLRADDRIAAETSISEEHAHSVNITSMSPVLPLELWALITSFVASNHRDADLLYLLTVSRRIHTLAEAALLKDVYLAVEYRQLGADDSQSPVIQFYQYCISISAPNGYRQRLVRSLLVEFAEGEPSSREIQSLGQLIPTLPNLHSLGLKFARYRPSNHGHLRLLEEGIGIGVVSLKKLEIVVNEAGPEGGPSISGLLNSQPSICDLTLSGRIQISENDRDILLPQLKSLNCFLYTSFRSLSSGDIVVSMSTFVLRATKFGLGGNSSVVTLTTMKSEGNDPMCFNVFLSMVPTLRSLEAYMKTHAGKDFEKYGSPAMLPGYPTTPQPTRNLPGHRVLRCSGSNALCNRAFMVVHPVLYTAVVKLISHFQTHTGVQRKQGTGWFAASNIVVTAGHLVYDRVSCTAIEIYMPCEEDQSVNIPDSDAQVCVHYGHQVITTEHWVRPHPSSDAQARRNDIAFIRFREPSHVPLNILKYTSMPSSTRNLFIPYPGAKEEPDAVHGHRALTTWDVDADKDHMIKHQISTHPDQSGAPIIAETEEGRVVVGTHCSDNFGTSIGGKWGIDYPKYLALFDRPDAFNPLPLKLRLVPLDPSVTATSVASTQWDNE